MKPESHKPQAASLKLQAVLLLLALCPMPYALSQQYGWVQVDTALFAGDPFFSDLHFTSNDTGWISSTNEIYKTIDGASSFILQPTSGYTNAIHMLDAANGYCGGQSGTIYKTTNGGDNWNVFNTMVNETLDISFPPGTNPNNPTGYACGNDGHVWRITSSALTNLNTGLATTIRGISAPSADNVWFCGGNLIVYYNGTTFTFQSHPTGTFNHIHFINNSEGWVVGNSGIIARTQNGGSSWSKQINPDPQNISLYGVFFLNSNEGWAVGNQGLILSTSNGGTTWTIAANGLTANDLARVYFTSSTNGYVVGAHKTILKYTALNGEEETGRPGDRENYVVEVWPNPTRGKFQISNDKTQTNLNFQIQNCEVVDICGNVIYENVLDLKFGACLEFGACNLEFDIGSCPAGIYFVRIYLENQTIVKKIMKL